MQNLSPPKLFTLTALAASFSRAMAHDGHGTQGSHWHATDVLGFVVLGGMVALAVWLSRDGK